MTTYDCRKKTTEKVINEIKALNLDSNTEINTIYFNGNTKVQTIEKILQELGYLLREEKYMQF